MGAIICPWLQLQFHNGFPFLFITNRISGRIRAASAGRISEIYVANLLKKGFLLSAGEVAAAPSFVRLRLTFARSPRECFPERKGGCEQGRQKTLISGLSRAGQPHQ